MRFLPLLLALGVACGKCGEAQSAAPPSYSKRPLEAVKAAAPPKMDGDLSDPVWQNAPRAETFTDQINGNVVSDQTVVRVLYDEKYIYVAFACLDSQPDKITAREVIQDYKYNDEFDPLSEDAVEVRFDPFRTHNQQDRSLFALNALGTRSVYIAGGRANKREWKNDLEGAVKRTPNGWTAEMRIPWAGLNYPNSRQPVTMGLNFVRYQSRTRILSIWSNTTSQNFLERDGLWHNVEVPKGAFRPQISLLPYLLAGNHRADPTLRAGLDARYTITPELTAVGSINPEFSTVEGAIEGIQFSRSERFVPESRPFFLEGGDFFRLSNVNVVGNYFFSRRIPSFDVGAKLYGKITPKDTLGFLSTFDIGDRTDMVLRYRHDLLSTSQVGLFLSHTNSTDDENTVGLLLQNTRWGKLTLDTKLALSGGKEAGGDAKEIALLYMDKLNLSAVAYGEISPIFRDANGFIPFTDYRAVLLLQEWFAEWRKGFWRSFQFHLVPSYWWHLDGRPFQRGVETNLSFETRSDWRIGVNANYNRFEEQTDATVGLFLMHGASNRFRQWGIYAQTGKQGDRPSTYFGPRISVKLFGGLETTYSSSLQNLDGFSQQHILTLNYQLSPTRSFGGRLVIQDADTNWYLFYRNSGGRGTNFIFVLGDPNARRFVKRAQLKVTFAL